MNTMPSRKTLILLLMVMSLCLVGILMYMSYRVHNAHPNENKKPIEAAIVNNDSKIVYYSGEIYYLNLSKTNRDAATHKISKLPINFVEKRNELGDSSVKPTTIRDFGYIRAETDLYFYNDMLYYHHSDNTYQYNPQTRETKSFCQGKMQYIDEEKYVTLYNGCLYEGIYYKSNFVTKEIRQLTASNFIEMHENDEYFYYLTPSESANMLLMQVSKEDFSLKLIDKFQLNTSSVASHNGSLVMDKVLDVTTTQDYIFVLLRKEKKLIVKRIEKKSLQKEELIFDEYVDVVFHKEDNKKKPNDIYFYAEKSNSMNDILLLAEKSEKLEKYDGKLEKDNLKNYSSIIVEDNIVIYKNGLKFTEIKTSLDKPTTVEMNYIIEIEDVIYYEIFVTQENVTESEDGETRITKEYDTILCQVSKDGGESYKMN